jgi:hypothetical protein
VVLGPNPGPCTCRQEPYHWAPPPAHFSLENRLGALLLLFWAGHLSSPHVNSPTSMHTFIFHLKNRDDNSYIFRLSWAWPKGLCVGSAKDLGKQTLNRSVSTQAGGTRWI